MNDASVSSSDAATKVAGLNLDATALLLDVDGTVLDIAPAPDAVVVPASLRRSLLDLTARLNGACALVSGRTIGTLDRLFTPSKLSAIGAHGAEMRIGGEYRTSAVAPLPAALRAKLAAAEKMGILVEDKGFSVALHFRTASERENELRCFAEATCREFAAENVDVLSGKAMIEIKRAAVNKGEAVRALMQLAPFSGRRAVFIGDDVTDHAVFAILPTLGGLGFSVGVPFAGLAGHFDSPADVRDALQTLANKQM